MPPPNHTHHKDKISTYANKTYIDGYEVAVPKLLHGDEVNHSNFCSA